MRTAAIYNFLLESTIIASIAILLMIPVRRFFRRALGSRALCFAWLLVAIRLLCPLALPNPVIHEIQTPYNYDQAHIRPIAGQVNVRVRDAADGLLRRAYRAEYNQAQREGTEITPQLVQTVKERGDVRVMEWITESMYNGRMAHILMYVYMAGAAGAAGWFVFSNARFRRTLKKNRIEPISGELLDRYRALCAQMRVKPLPVYLTDPLPGACLVGVVKPYIALPLTVPPEDAEQMLRHELWHFKAGDHAWTMLQLLCCAAHWFNPLVWLGAHMSRMDREMKCDENVTRGMDGDARRAYAAALVKAAAGRVQPGLPVLATGMSMTGKSLKMRVGAILQKGGRTLAFSLAFMIAASVLLVCAFATADPGAPDAETFGYSVDYAANLTRLDPEEYSVAARPALTVADADAALERVQTALQSVYMQVDLAQASLNAQPNLIPTADGGERKDFAVTGTVKGRGVRANLRPDGVFSFVYVDFPEDWTWEKEIRKPMNRIPGFDRLAAFALEAAEYMAPGIQEKMEGMYFLWETGPGDEKDTRLAYFVFRVPGESDWEMTLEYSPDVKVWSFGQSNG